MNKRGQATFEAALTCGLIISVTALGMVLMSNFYAKNILTKWASFHSRCLAVKENINECKNETESNLKKYFCFKNILIYQKFVQGTWHSRISAKFLSTKTITGIYDLGASEYKRTSHE